MDLPLLCSCGRVGAVGWAGMETAAREHVRSLVLRLTSGKSALDDSLVAVRSFRSALQGLWWLTHCRS